MEAMLSFLTSENITSLCLGIVVGLLGYCYLQYKKTYSFWSSRGVKGPTPIPWFGNYHLYMFGCIPEVDYNLGQKYGRIYGIYEGSTPVLMVSDPTIVERIFITEHNAFRLQMGPASNDPLLVNQIFFLQGEELKRVRGVITSALTGSKLKQYFEQIKFDDFHQFLESKSGKEVNVSPMFNMHMLNVVTRHFFGLDLDLFNHPEHEVVKAALGFGFTAKLVFILRNFPLLAKLNGKSRKMKETYDSLVLFISHAVDERFKLLKNYTGKPRRDLLQSMNDANFTDLQLKANSIAMVKAGFGTTQTTLCFLCYEIAKNQAIQEKIQKEIDEVMAKAKLEGRENLVYEDLSNVPILEATITEVLRIHPVDFRTFRRATAATKIPLTDIEVPANQLIKVPLHSLHFDPELFEDPFELKPERWLENEATEKCSFMAFGAGPRMCPGSKFADLNSKLVMINILSRYTLVPSAKTCVRIPDGHFAAAPEQVWVKLEPRHNYFF